MSIKCISEVLEKSRHAGGELLMLIVLADYADEDGRSYPAVATLARKCRMTPRNSNYILSSLQSSGELIVLQNEGPKGTNRYRINLDALGQAGPLKPTSPLKATSPLKPASPTPEAHFLKPLKPTSDEPLFNRQRTVSPKSTDGADTLSLFAEFYSAYPRKVGRPSAERAFAKCKPTPEMLAEMLTAIAGQSKALNWSRERLHFVPHPATWLNDERWKDSTQAAGVSQLNRHPQWVLDAGFANIDEAHNERCFSHNASEFRAGKRIEVTA